MTTIWPAPPVFTPEDSGSANAPIIYAAHPNELVTLSGRMKIVVRDKAAVL